MNKLIFLDTNILGMVTNPKNTNTICQECKEWLDALPLKRMVRCTTIKRLSNNFT